MNARICEKTFDLHIYLTLEDIAELKGDDGIMSILTAENNGYHFWLMKKEDQNIKSYDGIDIIVLEDLKQMAWYIGITEEAYQKLTNIKEIGTTYNIIPDRSKLKIIIEEETP